MTIMQEIAMDDPRANWETWRCRAASCRQAAVHVRRRSEEVWLIYERPGWVIAAAVPVCPACGDTLTRAISRPHEASAAATTAALGREPGAGDAQAPKLSEVRKPPVSRRSS